MMELTNDTVLETLEPAVCRRLLATAYVGRVGLVVGEVAYVLPVNFAMADDLVVFRTAKGSTFDTLARDRRLTFEIDHVDPGFHAGWSVMATGWGFGLEGALPDEVLHSLELRPWGMGSQPGWIGIRLEELTGRRIVSLPAH